MAAAKPNTPTASRMSRLSAITKAKKRSSSGASTVRPNFRCRKSKAKCGTLAETPVQEVKSFRKMSASWRAIARPLLVGDVAGAEPTAFAPGSVRHARLECVFLLSAESLHPISPLTTTMTYGVIAADGSVNVRLIYDHRVLDGAVVRVCWREWKKN